MDLGIKGRRALIFGGSRGVGRAVTAALAAEGVDVAVCARKEWAAQKVASEASENSGVKAAGYALDAWDEPSAVNLASRIIDDFGEIDILFGIARHPVIDDRNALPASGWKYQLDNGFLRFKAVTEALLSGMRDRQWGRVLWMIPQYNAGTSIERRVHSVTSAALCAWLKSLAAEVARERVTVNILMPARVARTGEGSLSPGRDRPQRTYMLTPGNETLTVPHVAAVATLLLSDIAAGVCGKTIELGGYGSG